MWPAWRCAATAALICAGAALGACKDAPLASAPNVVLIVADDLGWGDVGFHGSRIQTPNLDALARESVELERFYVTPVCTTTRAGLLTGRYPNRMGLHAEALAWGGIADKGLPPDERTFAELLGEAGYAQRIALGKWHLGAASRAFHPLAQGFSAFYGLLGGSIHYFTHAAPRGGPDWHRDHADIQEEGYATGLLGDEAVRVIDALPEGERLLLYLAFNAPHLPLEPKPEDLAAYQALPEWSDWRRRGHQKPEYAALVTAMDREIGRVLAALERKGLAQDTLVWFLSDNGGTPSYGNNAPLRGGKETMYEGGIRVPSLIRWPRRLPGGRKLDALAGYVDVLPTLAAAAGYAGALPPLDGIDLLPILGGVEAAPERALYPDRFAVVTPKWKLVNDELYDLASDPGEQSDVAAQHPDTLAKLREQLAGFRSLTGPSSLVDSQAPLPADPAPRR
jgi:arylsulfatase B